MVMNRPVRGRPAAVKARPGGYAMFWGILSLIFGGGLGAVTLVGGGRKLRPALRAMRRGEAANGVISAVTTQVVGSGTSAHRLPRPIVTFTDARGIKVKYMETITRPDTGRAGEHVTVHYDPADPEHTATIATWADMRRQLVVGGVLFLVLAAICVNGVLLILGVVSP
jgi:Protein of unknown function (DUF3592)